MMRFLIRTYVVASVCVVIAARTKLPKDSGYKIKDGDSFDYIVAGAGAAGCAVAARLALSGARVLLVEAGGDPPLLTRIPGAALSLLGSPVDWQYPTRGNGKSCMSSRGRACRNSRGKCLGGSTSINYMMYVRGALYDHPPELVPYLLHYEGLQDLQLLPPSSKPYHNTEGIMKLEYFADAQNMWFNNIIKGFQELNLQLNLDLNGVSNVGVSEIIGFVYEGERMSTARAYLTRQDVQANLFVLKNTLVTKVIIDGQNIARGVKVLRGATNHTESLYAKREVILSAGAIGTVQILLLSGIGPANHLRSFNITVRADLPVGRNVTDHVLPLLVVRVDRGLPLGADILFNLGMKSAQAVEYLGTMDGPLASNGLTQVTALVNNDCYNASTRNFTYDGVNCEVPNLQTIFAYVDKGLLPAAAPLAANTLNLNEDVFAQLLAANTKSAFVVVSPVVLQPKSEGYIGLASKNPRAPPDIFPNYLGDERDLDEMEKNIKIVEGLVGTETFKSKGASLLRLRLTGCVDGPSYWRCYARHMTQSVFHAMGSTARAVDERLRVRGISGLRVADAGVLSRLPRANTAAIVIAVGERAAHLILEDNEHYYKK